MALSIFTELGIQHHSQFSDIFITSKGNPIPLRHDPPTSPLFQSLAATNLNISYHYRFAYSGHFSMFLKK